MKKTTQQKTLVVPLVILSVVATIMLTTGIVVAMRLSSDITTLSSYIDELQVKNARVSFCHDNQIIPCDDTSISAWNKDHPEDTFTLNATTR